MSRFPKLTETFVLDEMLAVERQGIAIEVYPLQRDRGGVVHPAAAALVERAHFRPLLSWAIVAAHLYYLWHRPRAYLATWWTLLRSTWGSARYFFGALAFFPKAVAFARHMQECGVTHVHAHFASHPAAVAFVVHGLSRIPYSFTAHGSDLHRDPHMLREKVAGAAFVVAISRYNRSVVLETCGEAVRDKLAVIHCGVDTRAFRPKQRRCDPGRPLRVLCIGTLHEVKGQRYLLDALARLRQRNRPWECHLVGDGPDRSMLERHARQLGIASAVHFHGPCPRERVMELLDRCDVLAAPSVPTRDGRREGIPVVLMEAMASGLPVVASRLSGIPELIEHGVSGWLAEPGDVQSLVAALELLLGDPRLRRRLGRAGRAKVEREFDLERNAHTLAQHFIAEVPECA
jgi:glycosyltransferase involved in cell wall biosynthesis